jgi:hypothetical protein
VNVGRDDFNYQVKDLAFAVADVIPGVEVSINPDAQPDKRSYKVSFERFRSLAPHHQPQSDLKASITRLKTGLEAMEFHDGGFRNSNYMRLKVLTSLIEKGLLSERLEWKSAPAGA